MSTGRKRWWRAVAIAAVGGGVAAGGWFGFVRAKMQPTQLVNQPVEETAWAPPVAPSGPPTPMPADPEGGFQPPLNAEPIIPIPIGQSGQPVFFRPRAVEAPPAAPGNLPVAPSDGISASGTLPIPPVPDGGAPVVPAAPSAPSLTLPPLPVEPEPGVNTPGSPPPDAGLVNTDNKGAQPAVPPLPPVELPGLPPAPMSPEVKPVAPPAPTVAPPPGIPDVNPVTPAPAPPVAPLPSDPVVLPPIPGSTSEPTKTLPMPAEPAPIAPGAPTVAPAVPIVPPMPVVPQPVDITPSLPPVKPVDPPQPAPMIPDSRLNPANSGNTLNPGDPPAPPVQPLPLPAPTPVALPAPVAPGGREVPGTTVEQPKPPEPSFGSSEKYEFPLPRVPDTAALTPRDDAMFKLQHTAALAVLGGALFTAEQAHALAAPPIPPVIPPGMTVAAAQKADPEQLKKDLEEANKKIATLEKQVARLNELLNGKKDDLGQVLPTDPGAVEEIKRLKDRIADLNKEITALKTQTALRPAIVPEAKPKGIVKVVNEYPVEIAIVVNEKSYRVAPNTKVEVEVPAGEFTYQLLQSGAAATRSAIKDKETVTLRIK